MRIYHVILKKNDSDVHTNALVISSKKQVLVPKVHISTQHLRD